jgi:hypothetical protein
MHARASMPTGTLDILRLGNPGGTGDVYDVQFADLAGNSYTASMGREDIEELLYNKLTLKIGEDVLRSYLDELDRNGRITIENLRISGGSLVEAGLHYLPYAG